MNTSQRDDGASVAQYRAVSACAVVRVRPISSSSVMSFVKRALPGIGGGGGRNWSPRDMIHVVHEPAEPSNGSFSRLGGVGFHAQVSFGAVAVLGASDPSARARAITRCATARPIAYPASTSLRYAAPAAMRA